MKTSTFASELEASENFGDIFEIVKKSVRERLNQERAGLMLVLADLPIQLGAFHGLGTNQIVMNRTLLDRVIASGLTFNNSELFSASRIGKQLSGNFNVDATGQPVDYSLDRPSGT